MNEHFVMPPKSYTNIFDAMQQFYEDGGMASHGEVMVRRGRQSTASGGALRSASSSSSHSSSKVDKGGKGRNGFSKQKASSAAADWSESDDSGDGGETSFAEWRRRFNSQKGEDDGDSDAEAVCKPAKVAAAHDEGTWLVCGGYADALLKPFTKDLDIRYNHEVTSIKHDDPRNDYCTVFAKKHMEGTGVRTARAPRNKTFTAKVVLVTLPLGVLKYNTEARDPSTGERDTFFKPALTAEKQGAIDRLGVGLENKIVLRFKPTDIFWPKDRTVIQTTLPEVFFFNLHNMGVTGVIACHCKPPLSERIEGMNKEQATEFAMDLLRACFREEWRQMAPVGLHGLPASFPTPVNCMVTQWRKDEFSRGSFSFVKVGASSNDIKTLAESEGRLYFAGEVRWGC